MKTDEDGNFSIYPIIQGDKRERVYSFKAGIKIECKNFKKGIIYADRNEKLNIEILDQPVIIDEILQNDIRIKGRFRLTNESNKLDEAMKENRIFINSNGFPKEKRYRNEDDYKIANHHWDIENGKNEDGDEEIKNLFSLKGDNFIFSYPKPVALIKKVIESIGANNQDIAILDFFAGSGTTAQAVMELNAEDGGNRKFILCQIDEPINEKKKKEVFDFCIKNNLPPVISSITVERVRRAGEKILKEKEVAKQNAKKQPDLLNLENAKTATAILDVGFKVFDLIETSKIIEKENFQFELQLSDNDSLSKIYHLMLKVGVDNLNSKVEAIIEDCFYLVNENYYVINAENLMGANRRPILIEALASHRNFFIDAFTASLNLTLQQYHHKDRFKIIY